MTRTTKARTLEFFKTNADAFGVVPELIFLMDSVGYWKRVEESIKLINRGLTIDTALDFPIDRLIENLQSLKKLLEERGRG